ncbi:hypothetical protein HU200_061159 [Digitaria exilis]|uniref:Paired amphipathic helix n=1 Tax=Digitaria exilis TaxID=1010633 RepID=A0A835A8Y2_9POAL|nr:hypothetical protein HU200_061159 [Digitaria exilis]CAB3482496.1 unnamed protein product [Digitaria exilis]
MGYTGGPKRARETAPMTSRVRDPRPVVTREDAARFVRDLKRQFAGEPERYDEVFKILCAFKDSRLDLEETVERVKILLGSQPELLNAFNQFVPWSYIRAHGAAGGSSQ